MLKIRKDDWNRVKRIKLVMAMNDISVNDISSNLGLSVQRIHKALSNKEVGYTLELIEYTLGLREYLSINRLINTNNESAMIINKLEDL